MAPTQNAERLGDSIISEKASNAFFDKLDNNENGLLSVDEFQQFIRDTGGNSLDESSEIQSAVANVMISLDDNADKIVKKKDLAAFWMQQASLLSVKEVADWARHSMHMPDDVVDIFISNAVTGYDFPELIENEGELIESELGITRRNLKRRLLRGMIMRFTGMGSMPAVPSNFNARPAGCLRVKLRWDKFSTSDVYFPVHKYVVERFESDERGEFSSSSPGARWVTVYTGTGTDAVDNISAKNYAERTSELLMYRISAWNAIGRSDYSEAKVNLYYDNIHCESHQKNTKLPLDYLVGAHGGNIRVMGTPSLSGASGRFFYFGFVSFVVVPITLLGYYFFSLDEEEDDVDTSTFRTIVLKSRKLVTKLTSIKLTSIKPSPTINYQHTLDQCSVPGSGLLNFPCSSYDGDSTQGDCCPDSAVDVSSVTASEAGLNGTHQKTSKWNVLRARVKNKSFSKLFGAGRNGTPPIHAMSTIDENHVGKTAGIAVAARTVQASSPQCLGAEDIFEDSGSSTYLVKPTSEKSASISGDGVSLRSLPPAALPRARSFGDSISSETKSDDMLPVAGLLNPVPASGSCDNLPNLVDRQDERVSPTLVKGKYCVLCNRSFSFGRRMKHRCGKCNDSFCGECAHKVAHVFALPCKVPSQCICRKCGQLFK